MIFGRLSRRAAMATVATLVVATPAMAGLVIQQQMQADITSAEGCFSKVAGADDGVFTGATATSPLGGFSDDPAADTVEIDGVNLLEAGLEVRGMRGSRVVYTDLVRFRNECDIALDVTLVADATVGTGDWIDRSARIYLSSTPQAIGAGGDLGRPGTPGGAWDPTPIIVEADSGAIPVTNARTGTVTLPPGQELRGAITISAGVDSADGSIGTVNWVVEATHTTG